MHSAEAAWSALSWVPLIVMVIIVPMFNLWVYSNRHTTSTQQYVHTNSDSNKATSFQNDQNVCWSFLSHKHSGNSIQTCSKKKSSWFRKWKRTFNEIMKANKIANDTCFSIQYLMTMTLYMYFRQIGAVKKAIFLVVPYQYALQRGDSHNS